MANELWINYGGSCRKLKSDQQWLRDTFKNDFTPWGGRWSGHWSNQEGCIPDTQENRLLIKEKKGITISRSH